MNGVGWVGRRDGWMDDWLGGGWLVDWEGGMGGRDYC